MARRFLEITMNGRIRRALLVAAAFAIAAVLSGAANASTVEFDLTLTPIPHTGTTAISGTGILTLDEAVNPTGFQTFHHNSSHVDLFTITIDGITFNLTDSFSKITFHNGVLSRIFAAGTAKKGDDDALLIVGFLGTSLTVGDHDDHEDGRDDDHRNEHRDRDDLQAFDFITAVDPPVSVTPLPATWSLMMLGFAVVGFAAYRGRKNRALASAA